MNECPKCKGSKTFPYYRIGPNCNVDDYMCTGCGNVFSPAREIMEDDDKPISKYHVRIRGEIVDVYDILKAFNVTNPADQHAIKKMLMPGKRGVKDANQDRWEAIESLERAIQMEKD